MKTVLWKCSVCVCVYSRAAAVYGGELGFPVGFCLWAKASAHRRSSQAPTGSGRASSKARWAQEKSEWSSWEKRRVFCSLNNHTEVIFLSVLWGLFWVYGQLKPPCSLQWRMRVQEEGEKEGLYPGGAVSSLQASWSPSKFLSNCVGLARKDSFMAGAQQDAVHVRWQNPPGYLFWLIRERVSILCEYEEQSVLKTDQKCLGGNPSEDAFHGSRMRCDTQLWAPHCRIIVPKAVGEQDILQMSSNSPKLAVQLEMHYSYGSYRPNKSCK